MAGDWSDDMTYNGLYGILPRQFVAAEFLERVEVFRGANAFLNGGVGVASGFGVGGTINALPKRAPADPLTQVTLGIDNGGQTVLATDLARRFGPEERAGRAHALQAFHHGAVGGGQALHVQRLEGLGKLPRDGEAVLEQVAKAML